MLIFLHECGYKRKKLKLQSTFSKSWTENPSNWIFLVWWKEIPSPLDFPSKFLEFTKLSQTNFSPVIFPSNNWLLSRPLLCHPTLWCDLDWSTILENSNEKLDNSSPILVMEKMARFGFRANSSVIWEGGAGEFLHFPFFLCSNAQ